MLIPTIVKHVGALRLAIESSNLSRLFYFLSLEFKDTKYSSLKIVMLDK